MSALFSPAEIGGVESRNRIVMPPMTTRLADGEGHVTEKTIAYYRARAAGGVGLVTVEMTSPERVGRHRARELGIYDDRYRHGLGAVVPGLLDAGWGRRGPVKRLFRSPRLRNWFYYSARRATGEGMKRLARSGQTVTVIGDAARAGKSKEAIADAYRAALG